MSKEQKNDKKKEQKKIHTRDLTPEEKLNASMKKIDMVFKRMYSHGISLRDNKGMSENTVATYKNLMKSLMKDIYKETGKADIAKINEKEILFQLEKRVKKYKDGSQNESYNIKAIRAAVKSFSCGAVETKVFKHKMNFDGKEIDRMIKSEKIVRKSRFTSTMKATKKECEQVIQNIETNGYKTQSKKIATDALKVAMYSGGRVSAALNLRPENIIENNDGSIIVWFINDKGGLNHKTEVYDKEHVKFFKELKASGHLGNSILKGKRASGTFKSTENLRKEVSNIIKKAAADLKRKESVRYRKDGVRVTEKVEVTFSAHSGRKFFANERAKFYWDLLKEKDLKEILLEKRADEYEKIMTKYKKELDKVNGVGKVKILWSKKEARELTREEKAIFLTSLDTGHYRNNVLRQYYLDIPKFRKYQRQNL